MRHPSWLLSLFLLLLPAAAAAQQGRGTILGTVTDPTGAAIAGAAVKITSVGTGLDYTAATNEEGSYTVPNLPVGGYTVTITRDGFKRAIRSGLTLEVDQKAQVDFALATGEVSESLEVVAQAPLVDTGSATIGKVIENRRVQELPVNGRSALALVLLAPSVQSAYGPGQGASGFADRGLNVSGIRINGSPVATNNILVDGLSSVNPFLPDVNINPTVDAVQEFKVQTNTMSSEYGYTLGGIVNLVTKAGTKDYHGGLYEFFRNDVLDANSWANNRAGRPKQPLRYNQYGGSIGGPVRLPKKVFGPLGFDSSDRTFFFFNYEGYRFTTGNTGFYTLPTEAFRRGDFSQLRDANGSLITIYDPLTTRPSPTGQGFVRDPFPGNVIPAGRIDPVARNILNFYPLPNRAPDNVNNNQNNYFGAVGEKRDMNQYTARVDHRFSEQNNFSARYVYYRQFRDNGTANLYPDPLVRQRLDPFRGHNIVLSDVHSFSPRVIHEIRFGVARQAFDFAVASANLGLPQQLGLPAVVPPDSFPAINNGLPGFNTGTIGKRGGVIWQLFDALTLLRGNHAFKLGTEMRLVQANNFQKSSPSGNFNFPAGLTNNAAANPAQQINTGNAFATFLLGAVGGGTAVTTHLGQSQVGKAYSFYAQDDWKPTRRLTLNLGLRYDYQQLPYERRCGGSNFDPFADNPTNGLKGRTVYACVDAGRAFIEEDRNDLAPRVGFAFDVFGNQRTVVRGGYSIFYPTLWSFYTDIYAETNGFSTTSTSYNPPNGNNFLPAFRLQDGFPSAPLEPQGAALGPNLFATSNNYTYQEPGGKTPTSQQWNLSWQQQLPGNWLLDATYTANHGTHLVAGGYDLNQADPAKVREFGLAGTLNNQVANPFAGKVPGQFGGAQISQAQLLRPYPYLGGVTVRAPHLGNSIYHALLLTGERRFARGFTFLASYTFGKLISDSIANPIAFNGGEGVNETGYQNGRFDRRAERSEDPSNVAHRLVVSGLVELPFGKGRRFELPNGLLDQVLGGWQVNTITTLVTGTPLVVRGASNGLANRPDLLRNPELPDNFADPNSAAGILWFDPTAFINPAPFTFGNVPRAISGVRNPGAIIVDLSVFKNFRFSESAYLQFRAEAFNVPNHTNLGFPATGFAAGPNGLNNNATLGRITGSREPRQLQLALKLAF